MFMAYEYKTALEQLHNKASDDQQVELVHMYFLKRQAFLRPRHLRDLRVMIAIRKCNEWPENQNSIFKEENLPHSRHSMLRLYKLIEKT